MKYVALLGAPEMTHALAAVAGHGTVIGVSSFAELMRELDNGPADRIVLDPSLLTTTAAHTIVAYHKKHLTPVIAYTSFSPNALESCVVLARHSSAQFVYRGASNEQFSLRRALFLAADGHLGQMLLVRLSKPLEFLPSAIRDTIAMMLQTGVGPSTPTDLANQCGVARRSLHRWLARAGFTSGRLLLTAPTVIAGYQAITSSTIPLGRVAGMLGCATQRGMDARFDGLLGVTTSHLRRFPFDISVATATMAQRLAGTDRSIAAQRVTDPQHRESDPTPAWRDLNADTRRTRSRDSELNHTLR